MIPGRNDPCPCGSGRKYKKCHGASAIAPHEEFAPGAREAIAAQKLDHDLVERMMKFSRVRYRQEWIDAALEAYVDFGGTDPDAPPVDEAEFQLAMPWAFHAFPWGPTGESLAEHFRREQGRRLPTDSRALLDAQLRSWCSFWRIDSVEPGVGLGLTDLLTQEERFVHERMGSQEAKPGLMILGRVVDFGGISFIAGMHPHVASLVHALPLVEQAKRLCRVRTRPVALELVRDPELQGWMISQWRALMSDLHRAPTLSNTDGDPWESTIDHLAFAAADRDELLARLARLDGAEEPQAEGNEVVFVITRPGNARNKAMENTIIGQVSVAADRMRIETNSTRRADALRKAVLALTAPLVTHRLREEASTERMMQRMQESAVRGGPLPPRPEPTPEQAAIVLEYKRRHYAAWLDDRIPMLGDKTPRAAARAPQSRARLEALLFDIERGEATLPEAERFDVGWLREQLGMPR